MKAKRIALLSVATILGMVVAGTSIVKMVKNADAIIDAKEDTYTITFDSNDFKGLSSSFQPAVAVQKGSDSSGTFKPTFNLVYAKKDTNNNLVLAPHGEVLNFSPSNTDGFGALTGLYSVKVKFTGSLNVRYSVDEFGYYQRGFEALTSEETYFFSTKPNYFQVQAGDSGAVIESVEIKYECAERSSMQLSNFEGLFTGIGNDGVTYELKVTGDTFTLKSLDSATALLIDGSVAIDDVNNQFVGTFKYSSYDVEYRFEDPGRKCNTLDYVSITDQVGGAVASHIPQIDFDRVFEVEDFESYSSTGTGWTQATDSRYSQTGLRAGFFADYNSGGSGSPVGTSGFSLMGSSSDYLTLVNDSSTAYSGNKCGKFKASTNGWMRYWQYDQILGEPYSIGEGSYISMMVKNTGSTEVSMKWGAMTTYSALNDTNRNSMDYAQVKVPASSDWKEYRVPLTGGKKYGLYVAFDKASATSYVLIDNIRIYTANPYAKYVAPNYNKTMTLTGNIALSDAAASLMGKASLPLFLGLGKNGTGKGYFNGDKVTINSYTTTAAGHFVLGTSYTKEVPMVGNVTVTSIEGDFTEDGVANMEVKGDNLDVLLASKTSLSLTKATYSAGLDDDTALLQSMFTRYYDQGSGWIKDTANANRIVADTNDPIEGTGCATVRGYTKFRVVLTNDAPSAQQGKGIGVWMRNNGKVKYTTKFFMYKGAGLSNNEQISEVELPADGEWHYIQCGYTGTYYNFSMYFEGSGAQATDTVSLDYLHLY